MSKWCWPFSLTPVGWCITSTHHKTKTLIKSTTWKSFVAFVMLCGVRDRTCRQRERSSCINDKAPAHSSQLIQTFLAKHNIIVVRQALYSPNMSPCDFWLFRTWKRSGKGLDVYHEATLYGTRTPSCTPFAKRHPRNASNNCGTAGRCVHSQGDYFEWD
jgi:hypothetical protein